MSFQRLAKWLSGKPLRSPRSNSQFDDRALAAWVNRVLHRLGGPWRNTCLRRSAVMYYLLRRGGRPVHLLIGVQRGEEGAVDAHAWLTLDGQAYLEADLDHPDTYRVIAQFPENE